MVQHWWLHLRLRPSTSLKVGTVTQGAARTCVKVDQSWILWESFDSAEECTDHDPTELKSFQPEMSLLWCDRTLMVPLNMPLLHHWKQKQTCQGSGTSLLTLRTLFTHASRDSISVWIFESYLTDVALHLQNLFDFQSYFVNTSEFYDFIYILMPLELILNVCMCTKHASWSVFFFTRCSTWLPRQFSLHIFYLILSPLVYLAEKVLSPSASKWLWSFVQYFTFQISEAHSLKWQPRFVHSSITAKWAHKNNHISIVIWRRSSRNDLFALNYQQLNGFCLVYTL